MAVVVTCIRDKELFHGVTEAKKTGVGGWGQQGGGMRTGLEEDA